MKVTIVQEDKRLDEIVFEHYGSLDHFDDVVDVNEKLALKTFLDLGDVVELPEFSKITKSSNARTLWD